VETAARNWRKTEHVTKERKREKGISLELCAKKKKRRASRERKMVSGLDSGAWGDEKSCRVDQLKEKHRPPFQPSLKTEAYKKQRGDGVLLARSMEDAPHWGKR